MSPRVRLPVDALVVQRFVPRILWLRWPLCLALTPTLACAFLWAELVYGVLRFFAWLGDPRRAVDLAGPGVIEVVDGAVRIEQGDRTTEIRREDLRDGWMEPAGDETYVLLRLRDGRRVVARADDLAGARCLLQAAGVSASLRLLEVPLGSLARAEGNGLVMHLLGPFLAGGVALAGISVLSSAARSGAIDVSIFGAVLLMFGIGFGAALLRIITPGRAVVGADGVRVVRLFGTRFVPYETIREVRETAQGVLLETERGSIPLHTRSFVDDAPGASAALADRLGEAIRTFRGERMDAVARQSFDREGRRVADWKEALGKLSPAGDYRRTALESEDLVRVAEDPAGPAERRIGAALALSVRELSPPLRERLDAATATTANPRLRIALDKAIAGELTDGDIEGLEEAPLEEKAVG